jgi:hypothetical protein
VPTQSDPQRPKRDRTGEVGGGKLHSAGRIVGFGQVENLSMKITKTTNFKMLIIPT